MLPRPPNLAGPTLLLAIGCLIVAVAAVCLTATGILPWPLTMAINTVACFAGFTPVHEAAHGNIHRYRPFNDLVGHACATLLTGALLPYRFLHGQHHRHTNVPAADPDLWGGVGPWWSLPLRWATQDVGYLWFYLRHWHGRPWIERLNLITSGALLLTALVFAAWLGRPWVVAVLTAWFIPARLALFALACTFAWLPHTPHTTTDRFTATTVRSHPVLTGLLLGQNFHGLHHIYPRLPFYQMPAAWLAVGGDLKRKGMLDVWGPR